MTMTMTITKRLFISMVGATALATTTFAGIAQAWEPKKPIDFVIMAGAGGGADQIARFIQSVAEKKSLTTRPLVPNNKGGGSGAEALIALKGAGDPDYSLLVTLNSFFCHTASPTKSWDRHQDLHACGDDGRRSICSLGTQRQWHYHV